MFMAAVGVFLIVDDFKDSSKHSIKLISVIIVLSFVIFSSTMFLYTGRTRVLHIDKIKNSIIVKKYNIFNCRAKSSEFKINQLSDMKIV